MNDPTELHGTRHIINQGTAMSNERIERGDARILAAARMLCKQTSDACGINPDDDWALLANDYMTAASEVLAAADAVGGEAVAWCDPARLDEIDGFIPNAHKVNAAGRLDRFSQPLYTHPAPAAPAVPEHETPAMHDAVMAVLYAGVSRGNTDALWQAYRRAMLATAPQAAAPVGLPVEQEPKYTVNGTHIVNRASGEVIPHDEPVFIFRARDKYACSMIGEYLQFCEPGSPHAAAVETRFIQFGEWADANPDRMKTPDTAAPQEPTND